MNPTIKTGEMGRNLFVVAGALAALISSGCIDTPNDHCPQCNSHCRLPAWPRLIVGVEDTGAAPMNTPLTVRMTTHLESRLFGMGVDAGYGHDYCLCLDHLSDVACTQAYLLSPTERDVALEAWRGDVLVGRCQLRLPEHNYCGFNATAINISVTEQQQVLCGAPRILNICPG